MRNAREPTFLLTQTWFFFHTNHYVMCFVPHSTHWARNIGGINHSLLGGFWILSNKPGKIMNCKYKHWHHVIVQRQLHAPVDLPPGRVRCYWQRWNAPDESYLFGGPTWKKGLRVMQTLQPSIARRARVRFRWYWQRWVLSSILPSIHPPLVQVRHARELLAWRESWSDLQFNSERTSGSNLFLKFLYRRPSPIELRPGQTCPQSICLAGIVKRSTI